MSESRVIHVVASRQRRGAELFVADLVDQLADGDWAQEVVVLRGGEGDGLVFHAPTSELGIKPSRLLRTDLRAVLRLRTRIKASGARLLHAHGGEALKYALPASFGTGVVVAYRRIGSTPPGSANGLQMAGHRRLVRRADAVVAVSRATRREVVDLLGVSEQRAFFIPNAVNLRRAQPSRARREVRRALDVLDSSEVVVSVGALHPEKDPIAQINVFERVASERPNALFLMVGSGPLEDETRRTIAAKDLNDRVRMLGTRSDIADILGASDVLLLASKSEGMPAIVIEAGIAGIPVAGYALAGVPEVVIDGVTGRLAPPGDIHRLTECVVDLLSNEVLRVRLGRAARDHCTNEFGIAPVAARYLELYRMLTNHAHLGLESAR